MDMLGACATEFVSLVAAQANECMETAKKKTMSPAHVCEALEQLEFATLIERARQGGESSKAALQKLKERKAASKANTTGLTEEQLAAEQARLLEGARKRAFGEP